jgi:hypothetical protein
MPLHHHPSIPLLPLSTTNTVNKGHHRRGHHQLPLLLRMTAIAVLNDKMTADFWQLSSSTVWQGQWQLLAAAIVVVVNSSGSGIELMAQMVAS